MRRPAFLGMPKRALVLRALPALVVAAALLSSLLSPHHLLDGRLVASCGSGYTPSSPRPTVTSVNPDFGPVAGGTSVTITGTGFCANTEGVNFGVVAATSVILDSDTQVRATSPAHSAGQADVTVVTDAGTSSTSPSDRFLFLPNNPGQYHPRPPLRILDTRNNGGTLGQGGDYNLGIGGVSVPSAATAVILNVTVTNTNTYGALIVYPLGDIQPLASNLNWSPGETVPNLVSVKLGSGGAITIHNIQGSVDVVVDLEGYFQPDVGTAGEFVATPPARITDTRPGSGMPNAGSTLHARSSLDIQVAGMGGVPATGAAAVVLNLTVTDTSASSAVVVFPTSGSPPLASNLNWTAGKTVPNRVVVPIGAGGKITVFNLAGNVDVVVDVNGWFTDGTIGGSLFFSLSPARILDTRNGIGGISHPDGPNGVLVVTVAGQGGVPSMFAVDKPSAVIVNVTVTGTTASSAGIVWPDGVAQPTASDLNWVAGLTVPNLVVVKVGANGKIDFYNYVGYTNVVMDVVGYFS